VDPKALGDPFEIPRFRTGAILQKSSNGVAKELVCGGGHGIGSQPLKQLNGGLSFFQARLTGPQSGLQGLSGDMLH
jgi:hypothetical protein